MHKKLPMRTQPRSRGAKCFLGTFLYMLILFLVLFAIIFIIIPVVFKYSIGIQRIIIFPTWEIIPKNYSNIEAFRIKGVKNFYVNLNKEDNVTLGVWQILPEEILSEVIENDDYNYDGILANGNYNILLYMHGNGRDRTAALELYDILRKYYHIFAVDYRGYADSSYAEMTETGIVNDMMEFYKWLKSRSKSKIYIWGHSLGTGVGTHLLANLKKENISAHGLILETPFTSVTDVMKKHPIVKIYSFLPWFSTTIIYPMIENGFNFESKLYILNVDCPIMILHAKDDSIVPYEFATDLYNTAVNNRNTTYQGNVTYHLFDALGYGHMLIYKAPKLLTYISDFITECANFEKKMN